MDRYQFLPLDGTSLPPDFLWKTIGENQRKENSWQLLRDRPDVAPDRRVAGVIVDRDIDGVDARISGQRVDAVFAEAHVDVEITSLVVASGVPGQEVTVHIGGIGTAAGERVEVPNGMDLRAAVQLVGDPMRRQVVHLAFIKIARAEINTVICSVGNGVFREQCIGSGEESNALYLRSLRVRMGVVVEEFDRVQVKIPGGEDVEMNMMEIIAEGRNRPFYDFAEVSVSRNKPAVFVVSQVILVGIVNGLRDGSLLDVMVLPDVTFSVEDGDFPVEV